MTRATVTIYSNADRDKACRWCQQAPLGTKVRFQQKTRTLEQSARMWAMLGEASKQGTLDNRQFTPNKWKCIFMRAMGKEIEYLPELDGSSHFPSGFRSSDLGIREMSDLMEFMSAWGAENGVVFREKNDG